MPTVKRSTPSEDIIPSVYQVLKLIVRSIRAKKKNEPFYDRYTRIAAESSHTKCAKTIAKQCVGLANKCLSSHRYKEAAKLLWILSQDRTVFDIFLLRASMIVLENVELQEKDEVVFSLLQAAQNLDLINKKEVQLEYIIRALSHRRPEVKEKLQELINLKRKKYLRKNPLLDPIFEAYVAYIECIELCEYDSGDVISTQIDMNIQECIAKINSLIDNPGNWDIFVLKLVELYYKYNREEEVKSLLLKYAENNPCSLNACIYLCVHLNKIEPHSEELIAHLLKIQKMSPSDERVLMLLEEWKDLGEKLSLCLMYMFMFLDYPSNGKNHIAWNMLWNFLDRAKSSNDTKALKTIETYWESRRKSWHWLHFNPSQELQSELQLVASKVKVLLYFDKDHAYAKKVFEKFPIIQELLDEVDMSETMEF